MDKEQENRLGEVEMAARLTYRPDLPYHNFNHALKAVAVGEKIVRECQCAGVAIDGEVVKLALLFHDSGYPHDCQETGFKSEEEYAAHLAGKTLKQFGYSENLIEKVKKVILSTHQEAKFKTVEEKAVRAADLAGLAATYEEFLENTRRLKLETEMLTGKKISWAEWKEKTATLVNFYLRQDIRLTAKYEDENGQSVFHRRARENLERFLVEKREVA